MKQIFLFVVLAASAAAQTTITDTLRIAPGNGLFSGRMTITAPEMVIGSTTYAAWTQTYTITSGAVSVSLMPNDAALPAGTSYRVQYYPSTGALGWAETWYVTTSSSALKITDVKTRMVTSPNVARLPLVQLGNVGTVGQVIVSDGTKWTASSVSLPSAWQTNVMDHGAIGNGVADDTAAIQAAVSSLSSGGVVILPPGTYKISDRILVSGNGREIRGSGIGATTIIQSDPTKRILEISAQLPGAVRDIALHYSSGSPGQSGTCAICLSGPSGYEGYSGVVENVYISWAYDAVVINAVPYTALSNVWAQYTQHFGVSVYNAVNPDNGDITISGLKLIQDPLTLGNVGVYQASSGGLKLTNSKIIGFDYAYDLEYATSGLNTSIVMIQGNSFEGQTDTGIRLGGSTGIWSRFLITGNQIDTYSQHSWNCLVAAGTNFDGVFSGNMCSGYGAVRNPGSYPATGIYFVDTAENWVVSGNTFTSLDTGISIGATAKNITVGTNNWGTTAGTNLVTTACVNSSESSTCGNQLLEGQGPPLSITSNAVSPTHSVHFLGAGLLKTINITQAMSPGACVTFIPSAAFTYDATGNIVVPSGGGTATVNRVMSFCYQSSSGKFYPSY